jgi:copper transport protein
MFFDWAHLSAGSLWFGGLIGLLVLWWWLPAATRVSGLVVAVPRFSNVALVSVLVLIGSGVGAAIFHMPTVASLWQTSYGQALLVKAGLLVVAMAVASGNLLRTRHRLRDPGVGIGAARLLRNLVSVEAVLVVAIIFAAAVLSSLAPPSKALASVSSASAHVGPGPVSRTVTQGPYQLEVSVSPNRAALPNSFEVKITKNGKPLRNAEVLLTFEMLDMQMQNQEYRLTETAPGVYSRAAPALVMVGHWGLNFNVTPKGGTPISILLVDRANG